VSPGCIMDYPTAWKFLEPTKLEDHDEKCSYRQANRGLLCDCRIIWDEYDRRKHHAEAISKCRQGE
jgi:hypothetical protein